jgi:hypothetical protein
MIRKRRHTRRNYQVLRENESPQGVNYIFYRSAERLTRLCGAGAPFRPLFPTPFRRSLFRGTKDFPNHHWVQRPSDNRGSIRESMGLVNSIPSKKYIRGVGPHLALHDVHLTYFVLQAAPPVLLSIIQLHPLPAPPHNPRAIASQNGNTNRARHSPIYHADYNVLTRSQSCHAPPICFSASPPPSASTTAARPKAFHHCLRRQALLLYRICQRTYTATV